MSGSEPANTVRSDLLRKGILSMKLQEKILYCRKKAGLSQEGLAERMGVSRQAVSKWETGEALPETGKLALLAKTFGVTTDWLLSEEEPEGEDLPENEYSNWVESIPGVLGILVKRYGWLCGVYAAFIGAAFIGLGVLARVLVKNVFFKYPLQGMMNADFYGAMMGSNMSGNLSFAAENPVSIMGTAIIILGMLIMAVGIVAAVILKKKSNK